MKYICFLFVLFLLFFQQQVFAQRKYQSHTQDITPNNFKGSDIERIQAAINAAKKNTHKIVIPQRNSNGTNFWKIDSAILLPANMTVILDNCIIQLSDSCRDNMFRSDNVGIGITDPVWNHNISIVGIGDVLLKGADNPRSTGDAYRTLTLPPVEGRVSYGSDAGKKGRKQKGDWRNNLIQIAYVDGFHINNVKIENSHAWAFSFERTLNAYISNIRFNLPEDQIVGNSMVKIFNRDGIDLRQGCKYFKINDISGNTDDDFIALSNLDVAPHYHTSGDVNSYQVTSAKWHGPEDDIEQIVITNITCQTDNNAIAIRTTDSASVHHVYINNVVGKTVYNNLLIGGKGYGKLSLPGKINNVFAMNLMSDGRSLILIESPIANCQFINGIYTGIAQNPIVYTIDKTKVINVSAVNLVKVPID